MSAAIVPLTQLRADLDGIKARLRELPDRLAQHFALEAAADLTEIAAYCQARSTSTPAVSQLILMSAELQALANRIGDAA